MVGRRRSFLMTWGALLVVTPVLAAPLEVSLTVKESAGVARTAEPVSGGIPLPWNTFPADQPFALFEGDRELPAQVLPLVVDERGRLRWVLVDALVDLPAGGAKDLVLKGVKGTAGPAKPLTVTNDAKGVTVNTGVIRFTINRASPFGLFSSVDRGRQKVVTGGRVSYTGADQGGKTFVAAPPKSIEAEYAGPMRATICVRGGFVGDDNTGLTWIARITAWAGRSDVHVKYSLASSNPDHYTYRQISDSSIQLMLDGAAVPATAPGGEWVAARAGNGRVWACDLYAKEDPPRALAIREDALVLKGMASGPRWLLDSAHLSSQYVIDFEPPGSDAAAEAKAKAARNWLHLMAEPAWYAETNGLAIGRFGTQADELTCYDTWGWKYNPRQAPRAGNRRGMPVIRYKAWVDNHYDTEQDNVECLLLMYLRTGSRDYLTTAQAWANFEMDLQKCRTDGWRWKDGGVWWPSGGPFGNRPQRAKDPIYNTTTKRLGKLSLSRQCNCHNYGAGLAGWFCITGDRDALEAAIDSVEQCIDTQRRAFRKAPGKTNEFGRDFNRSCRIANAVRLVVPNDPFVVEASDWLTNVYLKRPRPEPRGFIISNDAPSPRTMRGGYEEWLEKNVGEAGMAEMKRLGITADPKTLELVNPATGVRWRPVWNPQFYQYAPLPIAIENYWRATGSEDALDWVIACGEGFAHVLYQPQGNFAHYRDVLLVDFPVKGVARDRVAWALAPDNRWATGIRISGYAAQFWPDAPARAYAFTGEDLLKKRAYDYWNAGSHRGYRATEMRNLGGVGTWVNVDGVHSEYVRYSAWTFYVHAHPRTDTKPPTPITGLAVSVAGDSATVTFTAPADGGGGRVARYQVKCSDKPIVDYTTFLDLWEADRADGATNWWMAANVSGEPAPKTAGTRERFTVTGVPAGVKYFAVRAYDETSNRSAVSNVAEVGN